MFNTVFPKGFRQHAHANKVPGNAPILNARRLCAMCRGNGSCEEPDMRGKCCVYMTHEANATKMIQCRNATEEDFI